MVYLEVIQSSDPLALGLYEFEFDQITIGRSKKNDLIFLDSELPLFFLKLKIIQDQLVIQSLNRNPFFFINGKKISGTLKIKKNDVIAFGENQIKVIDSKLTTPQVDISEAYEAFNKNTPELKFVLEFIEEVLVDFEKEKSV